MHPVSWSPGCVVVLGVLLLLSMCKIISNSGEVGSVLADQNTDIQERKKFIRSCSRVTTGSVILPVVPLKLRLFHRLADIWGSCDLLLLGIYSSLYNIEQVQHSLGTATVKFAL